MAEEEQRKRNEIRDKMKLEYKKRKETIKIPDNTLTVYHRSGLPNILKGQVYMWIRDDNLCFFSG